MDDELRRCVRDALASKVKREDLRAALARAKWRSEEIDEALAAYVDDDSVPVLIPRRKPSLSASEAFQYLMIYLTLAISASSLGNLLFNAVNAIVPDAANAWNNWSSSDANLAIAALLVAAITAAVTRRTSQIK